jgi:hypothetical protein
VAVGAAAEVGAADVAAGVVALALVPFAPAPFVLELLPHAVAVKATAIPTDAT